MVFVEIAVPGVLWLLAVLRLPWLRGPARHRATARLFLALALAGTLVDRTARRVVDSAAGVPDLAILLGHLSALVALHAAVRLTSEGTRSTRPAGAALLVAAVCMTGLFTALPRRHDRPDFGLWHAGDPRVIAYQGLFQACLAVGLLATALFLAPRWRAAPRGPLRTALLLLWGGAAVGLVYVAGRLWYVVTHGLGVRTPISGPVYGAVMSLLLGVALLSAAAAGLVRFGLRLHRHRAHRALRPLWERLTAAVPGAVLERPPHRLVELLPSGSTDLRLYRRVVEIRDAQLELIGRVPADLRAAARAVSGDGRALDACLLRIALSPDLVAVPPGENPGASAWQADAGLDAEVRDLLALARLFDDPGVVAAAGAVVAGAAVADAG
ncbi:MAB_1171c family putative transporter [Saccharothrix sp. Mg75]|uniref:MAB_1171c family putative transporter n=1 Tax=Saccharothrix sp. Mg75 TaxID=3445357 RepID=UPI003EEECA1B